MDNLNQIHKGVIKLNGHEEYEIQCYVVDNGEKVERYLSQSEVVKLISGEEKAETSKDTWPLLHYKTRYLRKYGSIIIITY